MRAEFSTDASKTLRDFPSVSPSKDALDLARVAMEEAGQWNSSQFMGRRFAIGCVALEITQRCNLDCSACYISEHSEAVKDVPIEELFRRIDGIRTLYGPPDASDELILVGLDMRHTILPYRIVRACAF